jgi:hypothetical protein
MYAGLDVLGPAFGTGRISGYHELLVINFAVGNVDGCIAQNLLPST